MGQCSTLPSEGRSAGGTKRGENSPLRREDSTSMRQRDKYQQKQHHSKRTTLLQVQTQNAAAQPGNHMSHGDVGAAQARNPDTHKTEQPQPMEEDSPRDGVAKPPEIAVRTRCYKLNLDSEISAQSASFLGPFSDVPPPLTYSSSDDSSVNLSSTQIAIQTAQIFRGITISKDGTILSQNARATRSNRGAKNKRGEKSRQAAKIDKAKDLVEESILTGKAPDSDDPANIMSLVIMGEYDDMKYLVRDGSKKLREATELPDDSLLASNRARGGPMTPQSAATTLLSPRKRVSPNHVGGQRASSHHSSNKARSVGLSQSTPPKLKSHPHDRPSGRKHMDEKGRTRESSVVSGETNRQNTQNVEGDWSNALSFSRGFHSIWNCGGTGEETGTISPTQAVSPRDAKSHSVGVTSAPYRPVSEGRDSNFAQAREAGVTTRAN